MEASAAFTSVGRAWYHSGVLPAAMEDWISEAKPAAFVAASARTEAGRAVARARRADCCLHKRLDTVSGDARRGDNLLGTDIGRDLSGHSRSQGGEYAGPEHHLERVGYNLMEK